MATPLDPKHWKAIAGTFSFLPTVNSRVYYFPEGHIEEASSTPHPLPTSILQTPLILCTVDSVTCLVDNWNEEVFADITLTPLPPPGPNSIPNPPPPPTNPSPASGDNIIPYSKTLTPSDLNNLIEFPVPLPCVDAIFPPMESKRNAFVRFLKFSDPLGRVWKFKTVYNKREKKHSLRDGWKKFVESKRLVVGDTVVFMKHAMSGRLLIGTRRVGKQRGNLYPDAVKDGIELAAKYEKFVVLFYPNAGRTSFVVEEWLVEGVLNRVWQPGMRITMALEVDGSEFSWFKGKIYCIRINGVSPWQGTLWRIFQVKWDEPEVMKNYEWVNPWQIVLDCGHAHAHDWEKYSGQKQVKLVDRLYFMCQTKSTANYFLGE